MVCEFCGKEIRPMVIKTGGRTIELPVCQCRGQRDAVRKANEDMDNFRREMRENEHDIALDKTGLSRRGRLQTFDAFNPRGLEDAFEKCKNFDPRGDRSLLILGNTGVGKTHLASAILNRFIVFGGAGKFLSFPDYVAKGFKSVAEDYINTPLLIVDEIGLVGSEYAQSRLYEIVNGRYESMKPTVYTSNVKHQILLETIGERNYDRLKDTCDIVIVRGDSRRGR